MPTAIEWTDETWNPVTGCTKVSPGCDNCYAERVTNRFKRGPFAEVRLHYDRLDQPLDWVRPRKIFVCSMGDLFHSAVDWEFICEAFHVMERCNQHIFQILTKRPGRLAYFAKHIYAPGIGAPRWPENIWVGTSVESAKYLPRLDVLARVPAKVRFVSCEPLLGPLDLSPWLGLDAEVVAHYPLTDETAVALHRLGMAAARKLHGVQWVIVGGESGPNARPMHPDWARLIREDCHAAGVPFFFKQWGEWGSDPDNPDATLLPFHPGETEPTWFRRISRFGKKAAGAMLDGQEWREFPE